MRKVIVVVCCEEVDCSFFRAKTRKVLEQNDRLNREQLRGYKGMEFVAL